MAAPNYWQREWFSSGYYPEVWFAPADETDVPEDELRPAGGHNAPPLAFRRYPQGRRRRDMLGENRKTEIARRRRNDEEFLLML